MDYQKVYNDAFANPQYCKDEWLFRNIYCLENMKMKRFDSMIDISSGRGRLLVEVQKNYPYIEITSTDLNNFHKLPGVEFIKLDLSLQEDRDKIVSLYKENPKELLTCLDVLEHLDKSFIDDVFRMFSQIAKTSIFTIANHSDKVNGVELHTIQESFDFWEPYIKRYFKIVKFHDDIYIVDGKPNLYILYCEPL